MKIYTVSEILNEVKWVLEDTFGTVTVSGEVSEAKIAASGHIYFTLKDPEGSLSCVMWASRALRLKFKVEAGVKLLATGTLTLYPPSGRFQLIADRVVPEGIGALQLAFEQLKKKLQAEGLFEEKRKKPIPTLPLRVGIITSAEGAAIRDFFTMLERSPLPLDLLLYPAHVQGRQAPGEIVRGLKALEGEGVDLIVLTRGGGSFEDLQPFNEEVVARAIAGSETPVISAVGHEVDTTIADFVADLRLATPTAAGEFIVRRLKDACVQILDLREDLEGDILERLEEERETVVQLHRLLAPRRLAERLARMKQERIRLMQLLLQAQRGYMEASTRRLGLLGARLRETIHTFVVHSSRDLPTRRHLVHLLKRNVADQRRKVGESRRALKMLGPRQVLSRGYSITRKMEDGVVTRAEQVDPGEAVEILLHEGRLECQVQKRR